MSRKRLVKSAMAELKRAIGNTAFPIMRFGLIQADTCPKNSDLLFDVLLHLWEVQQQLGKRWAIGALDNLTIAEAAGWMGPFCDEFVDALIALGILKKHRSRRLILVDWCDSFGIYSGQVMERIQVEFCETLNN